MTDEKAPPADQPAVPHSGVRANVAKDWKGSGQHNDTFASEGKLFCARDALLWPCPSSEPGRRLGLVPRS